MQLTEIRINLCPSGQHGPVQHGLVQHGPAGARGGSSAAAHAGCNGFPGRRLRAFCSLTFDDTFVVRDVKLIEGNDGLFLAMPSRKLADHCPACGEKNHLRARFCNQCGGRLNEARHLNYRQGNGPSRLKLHADVAHPINARCRQAVERQVIEAYWREVDRSKLPGYVPPSLDHEDFDLYDPRYEAAGAVQPHPQAYIAGAAPNLHPVAAVH